MRRFALAIFLVLGPLAAKAADATRAWVQLGPDGAAEARLATHGETCPPIVVDGITSPMQVRAGADANFILVCSAPLAAGARAASILGLALPLPVAEPMRILVLGDTGCRIKGAAVQDCQDPAKWPFRRLADAAARLKPDLVIHLGDYLYRETPCPAGSEGCAGSPFGDNWPAWDADLFAPAAPLMTAAPWVFVRGNHEDCQRSGPGFLRLLGPLAFAANAPCGHLAPYEIAAGAMNLVVLDDANAPDTEIDETMLPVYRAEFDALRLRPKPMWLLMHRPIWAAITGPFGLPVGGNRTLIEAVGDGGIAPGVELMLAGHIHAFEAINYASKAPPQIVAGNGGDRLDVTPTDLRGAVFQGHSGVAVKDGLSVGGFGFLLMTKTDRGWTVDLYDMAGMPERQCIFAAGRVDCPKENAMLAPAR